MPSLDRVQRMLCTPSPPWATHAASLFSLPAHLPTSADHVQPCVYTVASFARLPARCLPCSPPLRHAANPTFEDLTFDDSLDDMQRIARYATSAIALQRLVHVKMMAETAKAFGYVLSMLMRALCFVHAQALIPQLTHAHARTHTRPPVATGMRARTSSCFPCLRCSCVMRRIFYVRTWLSSSAA